MDAMKFKDHKEKKYIAKGNNRLSTTSGELKNFTKQVEGKEFGDKKFEKAYEKFKRPAYQSKRERGE